MFAKLSIRCLVTVTKHVNNTRAKARQLLGEQVPAAKDTHATVEVMLGYNTGKGVFRVIHEAGPVEFLRHNCCVTCDVSDVK
jgi:hypothetical protein